MRIVQRDCAPGVFGFETARFPTFPTAISNILNILCGTPLMLVRDCDPAGATAYPLGL